MELWKLLNNRYQQHSLEYATAHIDKASGLPINACMFKDNLQDVEEELADAIFNTLVFMYRYEVDDALISSLLGAWETLGTEKKLRKEGA